MCLNSFTFFFMICCGVVYSFYFPGLVPNNFCEKDKDGKDVENCPVFTKLFSIIKIFMLDFIFKTLITFTGSVLNFYFLGT